MHRALRHRRTDVSCILFAACFIFLLRYDAKRLQIRLFDQVSFIVPRDRSRSITAPRAVCKKIVKRSRILERKCSRTRRQCVFQNAPIAPAVLVKIHSSRASR